MFLEKSLIIIPTKDRSLEIEKLIKRLLKLKINSRKIIVIDSSNNNNFTKNKALYLKNKINFFYSTPSISKQRNIGLRFAKKFKKIKYIFFLDDDIHIKDSSFVRMNDAIKKYNKKKNIFAFSFNQKEKNYKKNFLEKIKQSNFSKFLGIYHPTKGRILNSGFQTKINNIKNDTKTEWIPFAAAVCKYKNIINKKFDENFTDYSYLEDLDFSLTTKKKFIVVSKAICSHEKIIERTSFYFGFVEVINRHKIVAKHKLNMFSFYKMIVLKSLLNFLLIFFKNIFFIRRFSGNLIGIIYIIFFR